MNNWHLVKTVTLITMLVTISIPVAHADLKEDVKALCDKIQTCVLDQVETQELPPQVRDLLVNGIFEQQCSLALQKYETNIADSGLEDEAQSCVGSLLNQDCEAIMASAKGNQTEECRSFEKAADEANVDLGQ